ECSAGTFLQQGAHCLPLSRVQGPVANHWAQGIQALVALSKEVIETDILPCKNDDCRLCTATLLTTCFPKRDVHGFRSDDGFNVQLALLSGRGVLPRPWPIWSRYFSIENDLANLFDVIEVELCGGKFGRNSFFDGGDCHLS